MPNFFMGLLNAGRYTLHAYMKGPSKTIEEMRQAQSNRSLAFTEMMTHLTYTPQQILARKQYWCSQTFFLAQLIKNYPEEIKAITNTPITADNETGLLDAINKLLIALDDQDCLQKFILLLKEDSIKAQMTQIEKTVPSSSQHSGIQFFCGDVIQLINDLSAQGKMVVADNAPNSHRDGAAKYSAGSVEELFSRYTDEALKMVLHFDDVHQRNNEKGQYAYTEKSEPIDVADYQKRYLKMVLTICANLVEKKESYLESEDFFNDLFTSFPNTNNELAQLPIYFDMQNNVYEVPVDGGFTSTHWFTDTKNLNSVENIFSLLEAPPTLTPVTVVSYAAPDLRKMETSPLDARSTSNTTLQNPRGEGTLGCMLSAGISLQCQQAIKLAQQYKEKGINQPVAVVFVMPGCGAFNNPEKTTAAHFISTIKNHYPELAKHNITCHIVEYNTRMLNLLVHTDELYGAELGQLNEVINQLTDPTIRQKAITVREQILKLYEGGEQPGILAHHLTLTTQLLMSQPGEARRTITAEYQQNALRMQKNTNALWNILGAAMILLGAAVAAGGVALGVTGVGLVPSTALIAGGSALLAVGIGLFAKNDRKVLIKMTDDLVDESNNSMSNTISN
ncbi:hypothetical protein [Legionella maioricensis]|uniref:Uncharacterized protein n=1 Tax=Legionella maioricensis TaxID=2896528 RepID=A0A9X2IC45_9GAMM|nr:hypothetical protein [Legionella maioricensis]MCL9685534.1 hypothetical protein [Legionella maioricensis]MCL9688852.1 hypothetical protein [Legionella maioricensis]